MSEKIRLALCGAGGRMGCAVAAAVEKDPRFAISVGIDRGPVPGAAFPVRGLDGLAESLRQVDVLVDFSAPQASLAALDAAAQAGLAAVVGTTGFQSGDKERLGSLAARIPVLFSPNMSLGMNLLFHLAGRAAAALASYDAAVSETHHALKKDAPSGTAVATAHLIAASREKAGLGEVPDATVQELPGARGAVIDGIHVHGVRLGGLLAHQEVLFGSTGETLTIRHDSMDRASFMPGVVSALRWIPSHPGLTIGIGPLLGLEG